MKKDQEKVQLKYLDGISFLNSCIVFFLLYTFFHELFLVGVGSMYA